MARNTTADKLADMNLAELVEELQATKHEALNLRFRNATGQLENTAEIKKVRRQIARINTLIRQREIAAAEARAEYEDMSEATETTDTEPVSGARCAKASCRRRRWTRPIVVTVTERVRHAKYNKFVLQSKKLYAHDETNDAGVGDKVRVMETRPLSKNKRWRLVEILERAR